MADGDFLFKKIAMVSMPGLIGKFTILIVSRRDMCEERYPGHPGGNTEAALGGLALDGAGDGSRGCMVHSTGAS